ncbi:MAG: DUF4292 domain-containing protein [Chitinophagales bacterium]|nr:DUF4292 domain-containing protein [Chitinophagales bacterium]
MMISNMLKKILFALFPLALLLFAACSGSKKTATPAAATTLRSPEIILNKWRKNDADALKNYSARAKIYTESQGQGFEVNANIVWWRDSVIWINIKKFGFEAARVLITPDSVYMLNRLEKTVLVQSLPDLQRKYQLPAGFDMLQQTLTGQLWMPAPLDLNSDLDQDMHRLSGRQGNTQLAYWIEEGSFLGRREQFMREADGLKIQFSDFKKNAAGALFPYLCETEGFSNAGDAFKMSVQMNELEVNTNPGFRFEIPAHYTRETTLGGK